jgi:hypothetical protein
VTIHREAEIQFSGFVSSDMTWLVFTSHSVEMLCKHGFVKERSALHTYTHIYSDEATVAALAIIAASLLHEN